MSTIVYLLQVSLCVGFFFAFYYFVLSNLTFFTVNRWYLLSTLALSFIIPSLSITVRKEYVPAIPKALYINPLQDLQVEYTNQSNAIVQPDIDWFAILTVAYIFIASALLIRMLFVIGVFFSRIKPKHSTKMGTARIIRGNNTLVNGSFLNYIFLNDDKLSHSEVQQIIQHEMFHVRLFHSVDRIILEMAKIILWFNPLIYLFSRGVEENHEFEVDYEMSRLTDRSKYADLLLHLSVADSGAIYHSFSKTPLEKRITMLFHKPTKTMKKLTYLFILPMGAVSCLAFADLKMETNSSAIRQLSSQLLGTTSIGHDLTANKNHYAYFTSPAALSSQSTSNPFYTREEIHKANGEVIVKVKFKLVDGAGASADMGLEDKLGIFIDGTFYDEEAIKKLPVEKTALLTFDRSKDAFKRKKIPRGNYAVPFCFKTKDK